jgi:hypothetical protein
MDTQELYPPLLSRITGYWASQAISVAAKLGLPNILSSGPKSSDDLAQSTGTDPSSLYRLLRALSSVDILTEGPQRQFELTPLGALLQPESQGSLYGLASLYGERFHWDAWSHLFDTVKTGETAFKKAHGKSYQDFLEHNPDAKNIFDEALSGLSRFRYSAILSSYDFSGYKLIVDVGGGKGDKLAAILKVHTQAKGILFDLPHLQKEAASLLNTEGVSGRSRFEAGDFFKSVPAGGDAYILSNVLHAFEDNEAKTILSNCASVIDKGGKLLVIELLMPEGTEPSFSKLLDLQMMVIDGGQMRSAREFDKLFADTGFKLNQVVRTQLPTSIVEAVRQ